MRLLSCVVSKEFANARLNLTLICNRHEVPINGIDSSLDSLYKLKLLVELNRR